MYKNILIPTDGSELAGKAVQHGMNLAKTIGAKITVLTVPTPFPVFTANAEAVEDTEPEYTRRMLESQQNCLRQSPMRRKRPGWRAKRCG